MNRNISSGLLMSLALIIGANFGLTSSASTEELSVCFDKYFPLNDVSRCPSSSDDKADFILVYEACHIMSKKKKKNRPKNRDFDKALECVKKVNTKYDAEILAKQNRINYVRREKDESCQALTSQGTCMAVEFRRCAGPYLRAEYNPAICIEAPKTLECLQQLEAKCPKSRKMLMTQDEVQDTINKCNTGHYEGKCAPQHVEACIRPALKLPGHLIEFEPTCKQSDVTAAELCMKALRKDCKPSQIEDFNLLHLRLDRCTIQDNLVIG